MSKQEHRPQSYSSITLFEKCPHSYKLRYIDKHRSSSSEALDRGNRVHLDLENFLLEGATLPEEAESLAAKYQELKESNPIVEEEIAFLPDWTLTTWDDPACYVRLKMDAYAITADSILLTDHKTGRPYSTARIDQGSLYMVAAHKRWPHLEKFTAEFIYVDQGYTKTSKMPKKVVEKMAEKWTKRINRVNDEEIFKPRPHKFSCPWCNLKEHCDYNVEELE